MNLLQPMEIQFSPHMVLRILIFVFWFLVLCLWSGQFEFLAFFCGFDLWIGPGFISESYS
jgi:hypothetical protein